MLKDKKIKRYSTGRDMDYHGTDRTNLRNCRDIEDFDDLPIRETIRGAVWRGNNGYGDNTSFGYCMSGVPTWKFIERLLSKHVGKSFDNYYSEMCELFKGKDRVELDSFIQWNFNDRLICGFHVKADYSIKNCAIVKNKKK